MISGKVECPKCGNIIAFLIRDDGFPREINCGCNRYKVTILSLFNIDKILDVGDNE